ncbi:MAG: inositol 2-dehydrogenase [Trueperaceae bacterium]
MNGFEGKESLGFGVIGAGRIGSLHARHIAGAVDGARLVAVMDANPKAAERATFGEAYATADVDRILTDPAVDAVLIASPTSLHAQQVRAAARAGKAIFCEKPIALELTETIEAMRAVEDAGVPFQIGFNRRFDPGYAEIARAVRAGELGSVEMFRSQSSDPAPPPREYAALSGGIYLDTVIHDIDTARFVVGEIETVSALGRVMVEPYLAEVDDVDTSILTLQFASEGNQGVGNQGVGNEGVGNAAGEMATGAIGVLQNTRRTVFGYDLRVEVHCQRGKLVTEAERATNVWRYGKEGISGDFVYYFIERFREAYRMEVQAFVDAVREGRTPTPGTRDAVESLRVAVAATKSLRSGVPVRVADIA